MSAAAAGSPERSALVHVLDVRPPVRACLAEVIVGAAGAKRRREAVRDGLRVEVWQARAEPERWSEHPWVDWALVITEDASGRTAVVQATARGKVWTQNILRGLLPGVAPLFQDWDGLAEHYVAEQLANGWRAVAALHAAACDPDGWWGGEVVDRPVEDVLRWAGLGVPSWADAVGWQQVIDFDQMRPERELAWWLDTGLSPGEAAIWREALGERAGPHGAKSWIDAGFTPELARQWARGAAAGQSPEWRYNPGDAALLAAAGWSGELADALMRVLPVENRRQRLRTWLRVPLPPVRVIGYVAAGFGVSEAKQRERVDPPSMAQLSLLASLRGHRLPDMERLEAAGG